MASRTTHSIRNAAVGAVVHAVTILLSFVARTALIKGLGEYYLGLNSVMTDLIAMFSLAELGFANAIVYSMYKPLADGDTAKTEAYLGLFKRIYRIIGITLIVIALVMVPFLPRLVNTEMTPEVYQIYALFVTNTVITYLAFAYRGSLLRADQERYLVSIADLIFAIISSLGQAFAFFVLKNYLAGLVFMVCAQLVRNFTILYFTSKKYPHFNFISKERLAKEEKVEVAKNVYALAIGKVSDTVSSNLSGVVISAGVSLIQSGIYSNYNMITRAVNTLTSQIFSSITPSVGNLQASSSTEHGEEVFWELDLAAQWIYITFAACIWTCATPFVAVWGGDGYVLPQYCVLGMAFNQLVSGFLQSTVIFKDGYGIFFKGRHRPLVQCILTFLLSVSLVGPFGIAGVIWAVPLSRACTAMWYDPMLVFKHAFNDSPRKFYLHLALSFAFSAALIAVSGFACSLLPKGSWLTVFGSFFITLAISQAFLALRYARNPAMPFFVDLIKKAAGKIVRR